MGIRYKLKTVFCVFAVILGFYNIACSGELLVVYPEWYPYYYEENGSARGFEIEIFAGAAKMTGTDVRYRKFPWKRCLFMIEKGMADVVLSALMKEERKQFMYYPEEPLSVSEIAFFVKKEDEGRIKFDGDFSKMKLLRIGVTSGFSYGEAFDRAGLQTDSATDIGLVIKKVLAGRTELGVENYLVAKETARKMGVSKEIVFLEPFFNPQKLYAGFSKKTNDQNAVREFSDRLARFKKTEAYAGILVKYGMEKTNMDRLQD